MSLRTCSWLLPQKEQRYGTLGPLVLLLDVVTVPAPVLLVLALLRRVAGFGRLRGIGLFRRLEPSPPAIPASCACAISELLSTA